MKKIIYGLGSLGAIIAPVAAVVACGDDDSPLKFDLVDKPHGVATDVITIDLGSSSNPANSRAFVTPSRTSESGTLTSITSQFESEGDRLIREGQRATSVTASLEKAEELAQTLVDYTCALSAVELSVVVTYDGQASSVTNTVDYTPTWEKLGITKENLSSLGSMGDVGSSMGNINDPAINSLAVTNKYELYSQVTTDPVFNKWLTDTGISVDDVIVSEVPQIYQATERTLYINDSLSEYETFLNQRIW